MHDKLVQQCKDLNLDLSALNKRMKDGRELQPDAMDEMRRQLDEAIASVRRISTELRPPILDDLGCGEAVKWQAGEVAKLSGLEITLNLDAAPRVVDSNPSTPLFRIVQGARATSGRDACARRDHTSIDGDGGGGGWTGRDNGRDDSCAEE